MEDQALLSPLAHHVLLLFAFPRCKFFSLTETPEDYTIIVDEEGFLGKCQRVPLQYPAGGWRRKMCHLSLRLQTKVFVKRVCLSVLVVQL